jgi:biopolymer transport protein ExbD
MRFPRNVKAFRGQLDFVPLASVLFLLLIFIILASLVYTPGVAFKLDDQLNSSADQKVISIVSGEILFEGVKYKIEELEKLRADLEKLPPNSALVIKGDSTTPRELALSVYRQARELGIRVEPPSTGIELPEGNNLAGTINPTVMVAVNLGGQIFFENKIIETNELRTKLEGIAARTKDPVTLVVLADKAGENEVLMRLATLARDAGIKEMLIAGKPKR